METVEAAGCPCASSQIVNKAFNVINQSNACPEGCHEWKREAASDKVWANLKSLFSLEAKEYRRRQTTAVQQDFNAANSANPALLQDQTDFRDCTTNFLGEFQQALNKENVPPNSQDQQAHASAQSNNLALKELQDQMKELCQQIPSY